jgi:hypothetical protein
MSSHYRGQLLLLLFSTTGDIGMDRIHAHFLLNGSTAGYRNLDAFLFPLELQPLHCVLG